jgi:tetratricopeptide (TPR) repeat protein
MESLRSRKLLVAAIIALSILFSLPVTGQTAKSLEEAFSLSYIREQKADYTGAISALKVVYDEKSYELNLRLGWLHYLAGQYPESSNYYQKAMKLMPYSIEAKFGYAYPASALGNWDQVMAQYLEILKADPQNTVANYRMGCIYYGKKDYVTAEKYLEKVVNLYPFDYDSNIMYAWTIFRLGRLREAKAQFHKVLLIKPNDSSAVEGLGMIK